MPYIKVDVNKIKAFQQDVNDIYRKVNTISVGFSYFSGNLDSDIKKRSGIRGQISNISNSLSGYELVLKRTNTFLINAASKYAYLDSPVRAKAVAKVSKVLKSMIKPKTVISPKSKSKGSIKTKIKDFLLNDSTLELIESAGVVGKGIAGITTIGKSAVSIKKGDETATTRANALDGGFKVVEGLAKLKEAIGIYGKTTNKTVANKQLLKRVFNLTDWNGGRISTANGFFKRWGTNMKFSAQTDLTELGFKTKAPKTVSGGSFGSKLLKWGGYAITGIVKGAENFDEHKRGEISGGQAVFETVVETAVDLTMDWAVGAAVATALSFTPIGAPALLVMAGTFVVTAGLDHLTKKLSGGKFENFGDMVAKGAVKLGKCVAKGAKELGSKIADTSKKVWNAGVAKVKEATKVVSNAVNKVTTTIKNTATNVVNTVSNVTKTVTNTVTNAAKSVGNAISKGAKKVGSALKKLKFW